MTRLDLRTPDGARSVLVPGVCEPQNKPRLSTIYHRCISCNILSFFLPYPYRDLSSSPITSIVFCLLIFLIHSAQTTSSDTQPTTLIAFALYLLEIYITLTPSILLPSWQNNADLLHISCGFRSHHSALIPRSSYRISVDATRILGTTGA